MSSILPGFEYDIFVSYRQKDNKGEHWVTEFVNALKAELEATFKEDISIYFDENAHDGLLATHDVDDSLKNKLRCLIFIPIVSQTYCDPKSFAWSSEFLVFKKLASEDAVGLKIKLKNGNVASRILPVRIHELDAVDKAVLENEIGPMRSVDFIFSSPGVNRPLKRVDLRGDNTNKCIYHDQVNKVANGVKEIIDGIKYPGNDLKMPGNKASVSHKVRKRTVLTRSMVLGLIVLMAIIAGSYYFLVIRKIESPAIGKSIAVLPFVDLSPDHDQEYLSEGLSEEIRNTLSRIKDLKVAGRTSSLVFKGTKAADLTEVGNRLNVSTVLEGTIQKIGNTIRISVTLSNTENGYTIWTESSNRQLAEVLKVQTEVAGNVATQIVDALHLTLSPQERRGLTKRYTENAEAYRLYRKGWQFWDKRDFASLDSAAAYYKRALKLDPDYALAYSGLADCAEFRRGGADRASVMSSLAKALSLDSTLAEALATKGLLQSHQDYDWVQAKRTLQKAISFNPNYPLAHLYYGNLLMYTGENMEEGLKETKKAFELDPLSPWMNWVLGRNYYLARQYDLAHAQLTRALELDSTLGAAKSSLALVLLRQKKYAEAIQLISHFGSPDRPATFTRGLAMSYAYAVSGDKPRARVELKNAISYKPPFPGQLAPTYVALGDFDEAMSQLERSYEKREVSLYWVYIDPSYDPLKNDPRFKALLKKMNLP